MVFKLIDKHMIWIIAIVVVAYILIRFFSDMNKDNADLKGTTVEKKFGVLTSLINQAAFDGKGAVLNLNKRSFNLYQDGRNQLVNFLYGTGHLTITWKYKYFQKEVVHEKIFHDVRNVSLSEQQKMAEMMISEMGVIVENHRKHILGL